MAKSTTGEVAEFLFSWFGIFDFLVSKWDNKGYKAKWGSSRAPAGRGYSPQRSFWSGQGSSLPKKKKKNALSTYSREGLNMMMSNSKKIRDNYSWIKTGYKPKEKNIFSWLR